MSRSALESMLRKEVINMTGANLSYVKLEGTAIRIRKMLMHLNGRATLLVRGSKGVVFVGMPSIELGWIDKVAKDVGCKKAEIMSIPEHTKALCGVFTTNASAHEAHCKACARGRMPAGKLTTIPKPVPSKPATIAHIEPGQNFDLNGVIASIEITHDRLFAELENIENLLTNLKAYRDAEEKLTCLGKEASERMQAVRKLLEKVM